MNLTNKVPYRVPTNPKKPIIQLETAFVRVPNGPKLRFCTLVQSGANDALVPKI